MKLLAILLFTFFSLTAFGRITSPYETVEMTTYFDSLDACTATSAGLLACTSDETGTGSLVFATSPTLVTPALGTPASGVLTNATGLPEAGHTDQLEGLNVGRLAIFDYDFAVDGGAISTIATGVTLPIKAIIEKCWFRVETQLVDAGSGTLAVQCEDAGNILTAADQTGVAAGSFLASNAIGTAATMVDDIAAACDISWVIAGAAATAGKVRGWCRYSVHL